ncbi:phosphatase PAP2 family protein [Ideonella sp. A 288]|uniref:phosphatase PAP2 family protein n=1 Tax=Ideonella sp. A 288 TaxID=1962181 RepID=UPI000B4A5D6A|nr:phosphatase PAP2 family protein [Ideonella sp. A 288]
MQVLTAASRRHRVWSLSQSLLVGLAAALSAWVFVQLGNEMAEGETRAFDMFIVRAMQSLRGGHPWAASILRDLSGLGSTVVMTLCTTITVGYLALTSARRMAGLVAVAVVMGALGIGLLKEGFARLRPSAAFAEIVTPGMSFPSGHAGMSAIVFLTLGTLLASTRSRGIERTYILSVAAFMTLLVGLSRVALGVHWATDVLAGWAYGFGWALVWLLLARTAVVGGKADTPPHGQAQP